MITTKLEIMILKEPLLQSIISDTWGYSALAALFWFNYNFIDGSYFVNTLILTMIGLKIGRIYKGQKRYTIEEARVRLDELEESVTTRPKGPKD